MLLPNYEIFDEARERTADQVIEILRPGESPATAPPELRAAVRAYAGFVESATFDWLRGRTGTEPVSGLERDAEGRPAVESD